MKNSAVSPESVRDSVVIVRYRDLEAAPTDRKELHRSDVSIGHVFQKVHRIEWHLTGRGDTVEAKCRIRSRTGEFGAEGSGANTRAAILVATERILKQKRRAKETAVSKRRVSPNRSRTT